MLAVANHATKAFISVFYLALQIGTALAIALSNTSERQESVNYGHTKL